MKKKLVGSMLVFSLVLTSAFSYADDQERLNQAKQEKQSLEQKLNSANSKTEAVLKEIEQIDSQMKAATEELASAQAQLAAIGAEIQKVKQELESAEKILQEKKELFSSRVNVMYKNSSAGYFEVVMGAEDIVDLFTRLNMIKDIVSYDREILEQVKAQKEFIAQKSEELKVKEVQAKESTSKAEAKKAELASISNSKIAYMETLKNDEQIYRGQIDRLNAESDQIIKKIMEEEAKKAQAAAASAAVQSVSNPQTGGGGAIVQPQIQVQPGTDMIRPVAGGPITSEFAEDRGSYSHRGIDIGIGIGTPVMAVADGTVTNSFYSSSYGEVVFISHGNGLVTVYAHNSQRLVSEGQSVSRGQVISYSGNTGDSTGPHLHFETILNGAKVNPRNYVNNL